MFASGGIGNVLPQRVSLTKCVVEGPVAVNHDIGDRQPLGITHLRVQSMNSLRPRKAAQFHETRQPGLTARIHNHYEVKLVFSIHSCFDQEWNVVYDDGVRIFRCGRVHERSRTIFHCRMRDRVKNSAAFRIGKDYRRQRSPIELAILANDIGSEFSRDFSECRRARLDNLSCENIRINVNRTVLGKPTRDYRFTRSDSAS